TPVHQRRGRDVRGGPRPFRGRQTAGPGWHSPREFRGGPDPETGRRASGLPEAVGCREAETDRTEAEEGRKGSSGDELPGVFPRRQADRGRGQGWQYSTLR